MFYNILVMGSLTYLFHKILITFNIEKKLFEKYSVNMMRSIICGSISYEAYSKYNYIWLDKCLENNSIVTKFQNYHNMFLSYFIFDTVLLLYQVYLRIEKKARIDLLLHHILAITALTIIENKGLYGVSLMIGLSEGMSLVTGPKLISMEYGNKYITNSFIIYRLLYLVFVRMLFIWPSLIYYYHIVTSTCEKFKEDRNILLVICLVLTIFHAEIGWLHSGRNELARI
jgi:hypothetical protein